MYWQKQKQNDTLNIPPRYGGHITYEICNHMMILCLYFWIQYVWLSKSIIVYLIEECFRLEKASSANKRGDCFLKIFRNFPTIISKKNFSFLFENKSNKYKLMAKEEECCMFDICQIQFPHPI